MRIVFSEFQNVQHGIRFMGRKNPPLLFDELPSHEAPLLWNSPLMEFPSHGISLWWAPLLWAPLWENDHVTLASNSCSLLKLSNHLFPRSEKLRNTVSDFFWMTIWSEDKTENWNSLNSVRFSFCLTVKIYFEFLSHILRSKRYEDFTFQTQKNAEKLN